MLSFDPWSVWCDAQRPFFLIAGPCVIESESIARQCAEMLHRITTELKIPWIYKSSFDKANRSSLSSFRGPGLEKGLRILESIRKDLNVPVLTDVHEDTPLEEVASVVDILQTPAFLCRQTSFIQRVASQKKPINIKKGQFLSPYDMKYVVEKAQSTGNMRTMVCERGFAFGYEELIVDMRSLDILKQTHCPVIFDATHSIQKPSSGHGHTKGDRRFVPSLSRAAVGLGIHGLFIETHPNPQQALSDGATMWPLDQMRTLLSHLKTIDEATKSQPIQSMDDLI